MLRTVPYKPSRRRDMGREKERRREGWKEKETKGE